MCVTRTKIEESLKELKSYEGWLRFQRITVSLIQRIEPAFIACERRNDLGLDAHAPSSLTNDGISKGLAASITAKVSKVSSDARKIKQNYDDIKVLIFATSEYVTKETEKSWADKIKQEFGFQLTVMSREDIVTRLMHPDNADLLRILGISALPSKNTAQLTNKVREAASVLARDRIMHPSLKRKHLVSLRSMHISGGENDSGEVLEINDLERMLTHGCRIILEAPAGRGKTTTLIQLANLSSENSRISFIIDLPAWLLSGEDILDHIAKLPPFRSATIDANALAKLYDSEHITFLLNGWNEISDAYSDKAMAMLQHLERSFPSAGIIVATRAHHLIPPLPGALKVQLLSLNRKQRTEYLRSNLGDRGDTLRSKLDNDPVLDQLTRTPLILAKVVDIFAAGLSIPETKMGVLEAVIKLNEEATEHKNHLQLPPLTGQAHAYLRNLAIQMLAKEQVVISQEEARPIMKATSTDLQNIGQISTTPDPQSIINALCAHHILEWQDQPFITLRFEHQQFQEYFAAMKLKRELLALARNKTDEKISAFIKKYVNQPVWEEPLQMVAQEIGDQKAGNIKEDLTKAGTLLVEMALNIDPIFAADLARLCGEAVWEKVGDILSKRLRAWYKSSNPDHRECALAGMMASGSPDFNNIILPMLTSQDQQVRLSVYREWDEFHLSTLGPDWKSVVKRWEEKARIDFVRETTKNRWIPEIIEEFAIKDSSMEVRVACMEWLSWGGSPEDVNSIFERMAEITFEQAIVRMSPEEIPLAARSRALKVYQKVYTQTADAIARLRNLLSQEKLGNADIEDELKAQLSSLEQSKMRNVGEFIIKPSLDIIKKSDATWVSHWIAERIIDGSLWHDHWKDLITTVPADLIDQWLKKLSSENLRYKSTSNVIVVLASGMDKTHAEKIFQKLCDLKRTIGTTCKKENGDNYEIQRQLREMFRALPPNVAVGGLANRLKRSFDGDEFKVVVDLLSTDGKQEDNFREELDKSLREDLLAYLKSGLDFVLKSDDRDGGLIADVAVALSRIGTPDDAKCLHQLIQADIKRLKSNLDARKKGTPVTITSWCPYHIRALVRLDPDGAEQKILELLHEPVYENESAATLVRLAKEDRSEPPFGGYRQGYANIWNARAGQDVMQFNKTRRANFVSAIRDKISSQLREANSDKDKLPYSVRDFAESLAILDSRGSADLIFEVLSLLGEHDDWPKITALENLLYGGAILPTDTIFSLFETTLQYLRRHGSNDDRERLLSRFLCVLPFVDDPTRGVEKIKEIISEFRLPWHVQRDILPAVGYSRCPEAVKLLRELVGPNGEHINDMEESWINAVAAIDTPEARNLLLSFVDPEIKEFQNDPKVERVDILASRLAELANKDPKIEKRLYQLCDSCLTPGQRAILAEVVLRMNTEESVIAGLNLIDDTVNPPIPYPIFRKIEALFVEHRPYKASPSTYTLVPRSSNIIRKKLLEMYTSDARRKNATYALLGKIEALRLDYGKPSSEPRHPDLESGIQWPPI